MVRQKSTATKIREERERRNRENYIVTKSLTDREFKIIQNVSHTVKYFITINGLPRQLEPQSDPVEIPVEEFNVYLRNKRAIKEGIIVELHEDGTKVVTDNPNVMLDEEIKELIKQPLGKFKKYIEKVDSPSTLFRILHFARKPNVEMGVGSAAQHRYDSVALPQGEPILDIDAFGRPR